MIAATWLGDAAGIVAAAFLLDLVLGDPQGAPHPVRWIGRWISWLEGPCRSLGRRIGLRAAGALLWIGTLAATAGPVWASLALAPDGWPQRAVEIYWVYSLLAVRDLDRQAAVAVRAAAYGDLESARALTARIVGRDTAALDEQGVLRAATETVAEGFSDGVVAPLFWLAIGGPIGMALYKAANTLDSMVGYRNERYGELGWFSARADDWANWVPARLSVAAIALAAAGWRLAGVGFGSAAALRAVLRDASAQPSPNAGYPEAAFAGALGVRLGGVNLYNGRPHSRPGLGIEQRPLSLGSFRDCRRLFFTASGLAVGGCVAATAWRGGWLAG